MTPTNTEALAAVLLASQAEWLPTSDHSLRAHRLLGDAAAELRRLQVENEALQRKVQEQALQALTDSTENAELLAERDALRAALKLIATASPGEHAFAYMRNIARAAMKGTQ